MKYILILMLAAPLFAQSLCHDEMVCTPVGGCRWIAVCTQPAQPAPPPYTPAPQPAQCHDEMICTAVGGCRWVTICK